MYTYKNSVTGVTITTFGKVTGGNWVQVEKKAKAKAAAPKDEKEPD
ncbi:MAG: hypothetical protein IJN44_11565 [Clostridia bacterium]|nr:hypothetical protein [Clostridia bacterium]